MSDFMRALPVENVKRVKSLIYLCVQQLYYFETMQQQRHREAVLIKTNCFLYRHALQS